MAFAWLAHCCLEGIAANRPSVTGARGTAVTGRDLPRLTNPQTAKRRVAHESQAAFLYPLSIRSRTKTRNHT